MQKPVDTATSENFQLLFAINHVHKFNIYTPHKHAVLRRCKFNTTFTATVCAKNVISLCQHIFSHILAGFSHYGHYYKQLGTSFCEFTQHRTLHAICICR